MICVQLKIPLGVAIGIWKVPLIDLPRPFRAKTGRLANIGGPQAIAPFEPRFTQLQGLI